MDSEVGGGELDRKVILLSAGASHTVALLTGDIVCSWGRGEDGQLGHGDAEERHVPTIISFLEDSSISYVVCGADHTTTISNSQLTVYSWGWGDFGRLGHGNSSDLFVPQPIKALQGIEIKQIACGDSHCLAIDRDGGVQSWGRNQNGQLGLGHTEDCLVPQTIEAFQGMAVKMVAAGAEHTVAVTENGKLYGWGWGRYGNLGIGNRFDQLVPAEVASISDQGMSMVACGWRHTIAVSHSGTIYTYGWSKYGQLGHGDFEDHLVPHPVVALGKCQITQISGGWRHTMALDDQGNLYGWGWNKFGQLGVGNNQDYNSPQPVKIPSDQKVSQVACGWRHTVALTETSNVFSWGRGTSGQLGHGDAVDRSVPKMVDVVSADGAACRGLQSSLSSDSSWILPSERYAVVPNEALRKLATHIHQTTHVAAVPQGFQGNASSCDGSVPDVEAKRIKTQ